MLENTLPSNQRHLQRAVQRLLSLPAGSKLGIIGLAFKEDTDDLRESPTVDMIEQLIGKGRDLRIWDPQIQLDKIYGANRHFLVSSIPHVSRLLVNVLEEATGWADYLVIAQKPGKAVLEHLRGTGKPLVDLVGAMPKA
jgi:GDP-mannose 6-dehydrogenase